MDKGTKKILNKYHVFFLVENTITGLNLLSLPHDLSKAGYHQWIIPLLYGLVTQLTLYPMIRLGLKYPDDTLYGINGKLLGKWIGGFVNLAVTVYSLVMVSSIAEGYLRLVQTTTLPNETITGPLVLLFAVTIYVVSGGIKSVARFCIIAFVFTTWMVYYLRWPYSKGDIHHMLPVFSIPWHDILFAADNGFRAMFGYELIMVFFPFIMQPKKAFRHASAGLWLVIAFYTNICIAGVVYFSSGQLHKLRYPVLHMYKAVELSFIERIETLGVCLWVFLILSSMCTYLWAAKKGTDAMIGSSKKWHLWLVAVLAYAVVQSPIPPAVHEEIYRRQSVYLGYAVILLPNLLLLIHFVRNRFAERPSGQGAS